MRKLLWFTLGFSAACLASVYLLPELGLPWAAGFGAALLLGLLIFRCLRRKRPASDGLAPAPRRLLCAALGLGLGLIWCWAYDALIQAPARRAAGEYAELTAELRDYPVPTDYGHRAELWVELPEGRVSARLYLYGALPELEPGDCLRGPMKLRRADRGADGETELWLPAAGFLLTGSCRPESYARGGGLRYFPVRLSYQIFQRLEALLPEDAAALPQAMLTGRREGLSEADRSLLSQAGASHIVAVSGLHVSMLLGVLLLLTGRGRLSTLLGLPLLALFVLMTGASPSVLRASLMLGLLLLAPLFRAENDPPTALALAALAILLANPWTAASLSFQLSFGAVAGLLLAAGPLMDYFGSIPPIRRLLRWQGPKALRRQEALPRLCRSLLLRSLRGLIRFLCGSLSASLGALLFTTPISALAFGVIPVYAPLTNLFAIPLATVCLVGSLLTLALGLFSTPLGALAGRLLAWPVRGFFAVCRVVGRLPGSQLRLDGYGLAFLLAEAALLLLVLLLRRKRFGLPLLALLAALAAAVGLQSAAARPDQFAMAALDVGQGQCVCMVLGDFAAVTDCGGSGGARSGTVAADWLREMGAEDLDALILTHYDSDHVNGVGTLLELLPVKTVYLPQVPFDPANRAAVEEAARAAGAELCYVTEDLALPCPGGQVRLYAPVSERNDNAACVSVLYSAGEYDMLITGDLDAEGELALLEKAQLPPVELYVAGHHGSARSSCQALLEALRPNTVFVSVGRNSYGLPSPEAMARLEASGALVLRTDQHGNLEIGR